LGECPHRLKNILNKKGIGSRYERWLKLEEETAEQKIELSAEQVAFIEKQNPCFRERHVQSAPGLASCSEPRHLLRGAPQGGRQGLLACPVVDTYSSLAFGFLHVSKQPEAAVAVLHNEALPFYAQRSLKVENVL